MNRSSKGTRLFDEARHVAYRTRSTDLGQIQTFVDELALRLGSLATERDRVQMARSLHSYMLSGKALSRATGQAPKPRRDPVIPGCTKREMQVQAGRNSATQVKTASIGKMRVAIVAIQATGRKPTQAAVARMTGLGIATVERHWVDAITN